MPIYIVRVQLHDVPDSESGAIYDKLHQDMAAKGFHRTIVQDGTTYKLPTGVYVASTQDNHDAIMIDTEAMFVIKEVWDDHSSFTVRAETADDFYAAGLEPVN